MIIDLFDILTTFAPIWLRKVKAEEVRQRRTQKKWRNFVKKKKKRKSEFGI